MKTLKSALLLLCYISVSGCSLSVSSLAENLNKAMTGNEDPYTVRQALPTYIILIDSLIQDDPEDEELLRVSSEMLNAYSTLVTIEKDYSSEISEEARKIAEERHKKLSHKSLQRAKSAICHYEEIYCDISEVSYPIFKTRIDEIDEDGVDYVFSLAQAWLGWLRINSDDWNVTIKVPQIKYLFETVIAKNNEYQKGAAHMYLGVLNSLMPENLGGKPELGRSYFEKAVEISNGENLLVKTLYAEYYARLVFNKELHNELLNSVINSNIENNEFSLINTIARIRANKLMQESEEYF